MKFIFSHLLYLQGIQVKFIYEGHHVKVKVTGAKKFENGYSCNVS